MSQTQLKLVKTLIGQADDLAREHEEFNDRYIISGRKALYELLGKIYALAEQLDGCIDREDQVTILRKVLSEKYGIRTQGNTSDTTVLVRYITQADRKTAHVYSRAIETARLNKVDSSKFSAYVEQAGGVERIRSNAAITSESNLKGEASKDEMEEMVDLARDYLRARSEFPLGSFRSPKLTSINSEPGALAHFICHERNGRQFVLAKMRISKEKEAAIVKEFATELFANSKVTKKDISNFYGKAMMKRKQRTIKGITKLRPDLASRMICNISSTTRDKL